MSQAALIVASSEQSVNAGAEIIRAGGNVIDAAIAAAFATSAGEPSITSLAGGGVMIHRDAERGSVEVYDLFSNAPGLGDSPASPDFTGIDIHFPEGDVIQTFHIGRAAAAVPGTLGGLCDILRSRGRLELGEIVAPVVRFLEEGIEIQDYQVACFRYVEGILRLSRLGREKFFDADGELLGAGDSFSNPLLAETLRELGGREPNKIDDWLAEKINRPVLGEFGPDAGGRITSGDLEAWKPEFRQPLEFAFSGAKIFTNPAPSFGGPSIRHTLELLWEAGVTDTAAGDPARYEKLAAVFRSVSELRAEDPASSSAMMQVSASAPACEEISAGRKVGGEVRSRPPPGRQLTSASSMPPATPPASP